MLTTAEIARSVYGAWRLAHADPQGMAHFDATPEGFWRSFRVAFLLLPAYALLLWMELALPPPEGSQPAVATGGIRLVAIELIAYAISWMAFPLAAHYLAAALGRQREYVGYIVAINWSAVLQTALLLPLAAVNVAGLLPSPVAELLSFAVLVALLAYGWFIARTALGIGGLAAAGLVAVDVLIAVLISVIKDSMLY